MKRVCVFCGSCTGADERYLNSARALGRLLVERGIELVYGGGSVGIMGEIARTVMKAGGRVIGVIPRILARNEIANTRITQLHIVKTMHERKHLMSELADGFIALPGGIGTLEEFAEIVTWAQLGIHKKPCGLLNDHRYYDRLIRFLDHAVKEKFLKPHYRSLIIIEKESSRLLDKMEAFRPPKAEEWIKKID